MIQTDGKRIQTDNPFESEKISLNLYLMYE